MIISAIIFLGFSLLLLLLLIFVEGVRHDSYKLVMGIFGLLLTLAIGAWYVVGLITWPKKYPGIFDKDNENKEE